MRNRLALANRFGPARPPLPQWARERHRWPVPRRPAKLPLNHVSKRFRKRLSVRLKHSPLRSRQVQSRTESARQFPQLLPSLSRGCRRSVPELPALHHSPRLRAKRSDRRKFLSPAIAAKFSADHSSAGCSIFFVHRSPQRSHRRAAAQSTERVTLESDREGDCGEGIARWTRPIARFLPQAERRPAAFGDWESYPTSRQKPAPAIGGTWRASSPPERLPKPD